MTAQIGFVRSFRRHPFEPGDDGFSHAWIESPLTARFARISGVPDWKDLKSWSAGRIFGAAGEYRWERNPDGFYHAVLLLDEAPVPGSFSGITELVLEQEAALVLWGEWVDTKDREGNPDGGPRFYAKELPHIQTYPLEWKGKPREGLTPRLLIRRYRDAAGEKGTFLRCCGVVTSF